MTQEMPRPSYEAKAKMRKEAPGGSGDRALETWREQVEMAQKRLIDLDPKSPDFATRSQALADLIKKLKDNKPTP